ncbi:hypothetical protein PMAYCL1PPCAC_12499 [Pristionchus mayeri]|uniref:Rad60/SUMO-like domain-containing protein n=1 Tax=Pristionchus mayeri TaxID=1317129 RepID=A0AAN5CG36_9BILA|nr:hypothetical protein PMAYCL1PPCAC_12499 [Pristionchus mayeri]
MSSKDGEEDISIEASPAPDHTSPKKSRYDNSSDEDDYYSNFDKMLKRNNKVTKKVVPKHDPVEAKADSPKLISSSDSESDVEEVKEENTLEVLMKKGKKFNEDREKKINADVDKIRQLALVREAEEGAQPDMVYRDPHAKEAESRLRRLKEDRNAVNERRSLDTGYVDCVVIDGRGGQRMEREYGTYGTSRSTHKRSEITFLLQDLYKNDTKIESMDYDAPMRSFVERITRRWNCREIEVVLTLEGGQSVTDLDQSPRDLNVPREGINTVSAVFVPSKKTAFNEPAPRDPNLIAIKFQSGQGKPAIIEMNKASPFSDMLSKVAEGLKMEAVGRMVFDNEKVDFSCTPLDLDMDDEDCMDVYAA